MGLDLVGWNQDRMMPWDHTKRSRWIEVAQNVLHY